jgi:hypothetical protein
MTTRATTIRDSKSGARSLLAATALTAVALAAAALWLVQPSKEETAAPAGRPPSAAAASDAEMYQRWRQAQQAAHMTTNWLAEPHGGPVTDQAMYQAWQQRMPTAPTTVYLVESAERQRTLAELGLGADELALVAATDEAAAQVRLGHDRPGISVIDLRPTAVGAASGCGLDIDARVC